MVLGHQEHTGDERTGPEASHPDVVLSRGWIWENDHRIERSVGIVVTGPRAVREVDQKRRIVPIVGGKENAEFRGCPSPSQTEVWRNGGVPRALTPR